MGKISLLANVISNFSIDQLNSMRERDYASACSRGFVHRKHKPKIACAIFGLLFLNAYQNKF